MPYVGLTWYCFYYPAADMNTDNDTTCLDNVEKLTRNSQRALIDPVNAAQIHRNAIIYINTRALPGGRNAPRSKSRRIRQNIDADAAMRRASAVAVDRCAFNCGGSVG